MQFIAIVRLVIKIILFLVYAKRALDTKLSRIKSVKINVDVRSYGHNYFAMRDSFTTGDIVLFSGKGIISWMIKFVTGSEWSHVGIIQRNTPQDPVLILESTTMSNTKDLMSGKVRSGVQLSSLSDRLKNYEGTMAIVKLTGTLPVDLNARFEEFRSKVRDLPYEKSFVQLFRSAYDGAFGRNKRVDASSLFCSELVAAALQYVGVMSSDIPPDEYTPADFDPRNNKVRLLGNLRLSELKYIYL